MWGAPDRAVDPALFSGYWRSEMARILIIEDEEMMREFLRELLEEAGYQVEEAENGKVGVELYRKDPADLVITDLFMPEKDGIEALLELQAEFPEVKVIAVSGGSRMGRTDLLSVVGDLGVQRTFRKPFHMSELLEAVKELLGEG